MLEGALFDVEAGAVHDHGQGGHGWAGFEAEFELGNGTAELARDAKNCSQESRLLMTALMGCRTTMTICVSWWL
jgi:hypothetical protein